MKKVLALILALVLVLSLVACGGGSDSGEENVEKTTTESKDVLLKKAKPLGMDGYKAIDNMAFAKSLIGNTYTFDGEAYSVEDDYVIIRFSVKNEENNADLYSYGNIVGAVYLPLSELASIEIGYMYSFVGRLTNAEKFDFNGHHGAKTYTKLSFETSAIVSDRFEATGMLDSPNASYGNNSWNIKLPNNNYLWLVYFRDDVSAYKGKEITFSYKLSDGHPRDAYIIN